MMKKLNHPCIVRLYHIFETAVPPALDLVMELLSGGDLLDCVLNNTRLTEERASRKTSSHRCMVYGAWCMVQ